MAKHLEKGKKGEQMAAEYLEERGFEILERNFRFGKGEIDLIARKGLLLVFVEVKSRNSILFGYPEEAVGHKKVQKIMETAEEYIFASDWKGPVRYDIISIVKDQQIMHFEDAFY